jgi:hypothetical protein
VDYSHSKENFEIERRKINIEKLIIESRRGR